MGRKVNEAKSQIKSQKSIKDGTVKDPLSKFPLLLQAKEKLLDSSLHENFQRVFHDVDIEILLCAIPWIWRTTTLPHELTSWCQHWLEATERSVSNDHIQLLAPSRVTTKSPLFRDMSPTVLIFPSDCSGWIFILLVEMRLLAITQKVGIMNAINNFSVDCSVSHYSAHPCCLWATSHIDYSARQRL